MEGNRRREQRWGKAKNGGRKRSTLNKGDHGRGGGRGGRGGGRGRTYKRGSVDSAPLPAKFLTLASAAGVYHPAAHGELRRLGPIEYRTSNVSARFLATSAIACSLVGIFRIRNRTTRPPGSGSHSSTIQNVPSFAWHFWTRRLALPACVTSRSRVSPVRYPRLPRLRAIRSICRREDKADGAVDRGDRGRQRSAILGRLALGETMVRCSCCHQLVAALVEVPSTRQPVCARCLSQIRGMLGVWDVLIARAKQRTKPSDA